MDEDDTVFDSFVVDNSVVEYLSSLDELDMVDEFESDAESSNKTRYLYVGCYFHNYCSSNKTRYERRIPD